jgi:hypothetical protein
MKTLLILAALCLSACSTQNKPLAMVRDDDPVMQLNPDRWTATANDLMVPPGDGAPRPLPAPVDTGATKVQFDGR